MIRTVTDIQPRHINRAMDAFLRHYTARDAAYRIEKIYLKRTLNFARNPTRAVLARTIMYRMHRAATLERTLWGPL